MKKLLLTGCLLAAMGLPTTIQAQTSIDDIVGTYNGTAYEYDEKADYYDFSATIELRDGVDNGLKINGLFTPFVEGYVNATFNPDDNTISVSYQWVKDASGANTAYYLYISGDTKKPITFNVGNGVLTQIGNDYFDLYAYYDASLPAYNIDEVTLVKEGATVDPEPEPDIEALLGTYDVSYTDYYWDTQNIEGVIITKGTTENSLMIKNLFQPLSYDAIVATYNPSNNTITISSQTVGSFTVDTYTEAYNEVEGDIVLTISNGKITCPSDQAVEIYNSTDFVWVEEAVFTKVSDSTEDPFENQEPEVDPALEALLGSYRGTSHLRTDSEIQAFEATIEINEGVANGLKLNGIFLPFAEGYMNATFNPDTNTISVANQYLKDASGASTDFYVYISGGYGTINFSVQDGTILMEGSDYFDLYAYYVPELPNYHIVDIQLVKEGAEETVVEGMKFTVDGISYTITSVAEGNNTVTTTASEYSNMGANNDVEGDVVIPETVTFNDIEFTVTAIGMYSFAGAKITNLSIPATVKNIYYAAFFNCNQLQTVTNNAVTPQSIQETSNSGATQRGYIFYGSSYNSAVLFVPEESVDAYKAAAVWRDFGKVIAIGEDPNQVNAGDNFEFEGIIYTVIDPAELTVKTKNGTYFNQGGYWEGQNVGKENLEIPETAYFQGDPYTVIEIGDGSFAYSDGGEGLKSIVIPNTVETIGEGAFSENYNVTSISFGSGLKTIGADAFYSADSLEEVSITAVVPPVADQDAFYSTNVAVVTLTVPTESIEAYATADVWKEFNLEVTVNVTISQPEDEEVVKEVALDGTAVENWTEGFEATSGQGLSITFDVPEGYELTVTVNEVDVTKDVEDNVYTTVVGYVDLAIEVTLTEEGTDGINNIESVDGIEAIYNLNGVRVSKDRLTKGLYIINGQKVLVK